MQRIGVCGAAVLALVAIGATTSAVAQTISGRATVISGDTLEVRGERIRLMGVDAPASDLVCDATDEHRWRCGQRAMSALEVFLDESIVTCVGREREPVGQLLALCTANGIDLGLWLVRNGLALERPDGSRYRQAQEQAKAAQKGIWSGRQR
jgi:endonuclease YncB( thermonuclease family)